MGLDTKSRLIMEVLLRNPFITSKELVEDQQISKRQLTYLLSKINEYLKMKGLPKISRNKTGLFIIPDELFVQQQHKSQSIESHQDFFTEEQRILVIILMTLTSDEELSLVHFASSLQVSKNTILSDLKKVKEYVQNFEVNFVYNRTSGYLITGDEYAIRKLLISIIRECMDMSNGEKFAQRYGRIKEEDIKDIADRMMEIENRLQLKFTDDRMAIMPYVIASILRRVRLGYSIEHFQLRYEEIANTKEYLATEELFSDYKYVSTNERVYIALHLLSTTLHSSKFAEESVMPQIREAIELFLIDFERQACVILKDKEQLISQLLLHATPAYYRIKYRLSELNQVDISFTKDFKELHYLVKKTLTPFAKLFDQPIPENEIIYFSILIGGWLSKQGDNVAEKIRAIVVCPHGTSISKMLMNTLKRVFPDFIFLGSMSLREFQEYKQDYHIVFSNVPLKTIKRQYCINKFPTNTEWKKLQKLVVNDLYGYKPQTPELDVIMQIVAESSTIQDKAKLRRELAAYLHGPSEISKFDLNVTKRNLLQMMETDYVQFIDCVKDWKEAIYIAAQPLIRNNIIKPEYRDAVIQGYNYDSDYLFLGDKTVIPHTDPEYGALKVGMSFLIVKQGINFSKNKKANFVVLLSAIDREQHLRALLELTDIAQNDQKINQVIASVSYQQIHELIKQFIEKEKEEYSDV
ncbi:BglG family transcription antiterminator [Oceanobacillus sp. FSL W8-0428]|uniref:Ascorbate-specific PTS system EIIA component n=1 Tax=Oceanobacillus sojae TaxID=582851 RepID=A0A511ZEE9_9BACI|nr:BglG family transcription antiterminator [Oceanobacillus sojae]GEN85824.1 PTS sugar transporter subunit IIA [Oceanobacillus sojae]